MADETIVDIYCHIFPDEFFQEMNRIAPRLGNIGARLRGVKKLFDLDERFREMDQFGDYREIISLPNPPIEDLASGAIGLNLARIGNDAMAELCERHPARFPTFVAAVSMTDVEGSVQEARRAVKELGAGGIQIFTNVAGRPLDDPAFEPVFATMAELDLPIWLHPARTASMPDYPAEPKSRFEMWWCFGWPYDTSVAMVRMVLSGLLDRYPRLKIITHHLGGMIPYYDGRVGPGLQVLGQPHPGRGLFEDPAVARSGRTSTICAISTATPRCSAAASRRCAAGSNSSAATTWCSRPTLRSGRSRRRSRRSSGSTSRTPIGARSSRAMPRSS